MDDRPREALETLRQRSVDPRLAERPCGESSRPGAQSPLVCDASILHPGPWQAREPRPANPASAFPSRPQNACPDIRLPLSLAAISTFPPFSAPRWALPLPDLPKP